MSLITRHCKQRLKERMEDVINLNQAKRTAKQARISGKTINDYKNYPEFADYLRLKKYRYNNNQIRVYKGCIYIWKGRSRTLVTAYKIPDRFMENLKEV